MKNLLKLLFATVLFTSLFMASCTKEEDDLVVENKNFEILKSHLLANNLDLDSILVAWIAPANIVHDSNNDSIITNDYYVIDIRSTTDYVAGHIPGSVNCALTDIITTAANAGGKKIVIACYTGQTAAVGCVALRLSGYPKAQVLKFGMSSWNVACDKWTANVGDIAIGNANWEAGTSTLGSLVNYGDPIITSSKTTGAELLAERVAALLASGFQKVTATEALTTPSNYFINNYWAEADVNTYGHIKGCVRVLPLTLKGNQYQNYDPSRTALTYCWTGQTASMVSSYMRILGYEAKTIGFGCNAMIHSNLQANKWTSAQIKGYSLETK